ncbi:MAG: OadG family protein [Endozoicomonas sp.]
MTPSDLISEGLSLMLFGMGFVFLFLTMLVLVTSLMSRVIGRCFSEPLPSSVLAAAKQKTPVLQSPARPQTELVAVISAAIRMHRTRKEPTDKS